MALVTCPDCSREVSSNAVSCPHCGAPLRNAAKPTVVAKEGFFLRTMNAGCLGCLGFVAFVAVLTAVVGSDTQSDSSADSPAAEPAPQANESRGTITVDRVWEEFDYGNALVSYVNDSGRTFGSVVTIQCVALNASGGKVNQNTRSFFAREVGPIAPGYTGTVSIPVSLNGDHVASMQCDIQSAR